MIAVETIENEIKKISPKKLAEFRLWFSKYDSDVWDAQIEADAATEKLDTLARETIAEYDLGKAQEI